MVGFNIKKNEIEKCEFNDNPLNIRAFQNEESISDSEETISEGNSENFDESETEMMTYEEMEEIEEIEEIEEKEKINHEKKQQIKNTKKLIKILDKIKILKFKLEKKYTSKKYNELFNYMSKLFKFVVKCKFSFDDEISSKLTSYLDNQIDYFKDDKSKRNVLYFTIYNIVIFKEEE